MGKRLKLVRDMAQGVVGELRAAVGTHPGTTCFNTKMAPIVGVRYTRPAPGGDDLDLCEPCLLAYRTGPARGERRLPFKRVPHPVREVAL